MRIRDATEADLPVLADVERAAGEMFRGIGMAEIADDAPPAPAVLDAARRGGWAWVAADDADRPAAYLIGEVVDGGLHVEQVSVHPRAARRGVGRRLIEHAARAAAARGLTSLTLTTFGEVAWNAAYYERCGFRRLTDAELTPGLARIRRREAALGLNRWRRVCMRRDVTRDDKGDDAGEDGRREAQGWEGAVGERAVGERAVGERAVDRRRLVPRTDVVLADPRLVRAADRLGRAPVKAAVVAAQHRARAGEIEPADVVAAAVAALPDGSAAPRIVLNATGVVLHTNLGRAALSPAAVAAVTAAAGHTDVELDLVTGRRARRGRGALDALAAAAPGAAAVHVVNNGAAALVLAATALAADGDIIVSRGELVEIGDGFRLPDLLQSTGARLREVGTTNRTSVADYAAAVGPRTGFILKVHPSNFVVRGFTSAVDVAALTGLGVPVVADIGSGLLTPDPLLPDEPDAATTLRGGANLVIASGDKLLGGPQAGLLLGDADLIERLRRHPLARALRVDKLTLAALQATVAPSETGRNPTWQALRADPEALRARTDRIRARLAAAGVDVALVASAAVVGGGGAPELTLPSWALSLPEGYAGPLRLGAPPIVGRVERGRLLLDLRCVPPPADGEVVAAVSAVAAREAEH